MTRLFPLAAAILNLSLFAAEPAFIGAREPNQTRTQQPLSPSEQQALFSLPPGFEIELVASEDESQELGKFVAVYWDLQGRMWSMTALEYPVDANESPEQAKALYESIARDKVVVWDDPFGPGPHRARIFAEGLAIPLGILPYKNGVYVQHGPNIDFLEDTNADGKADARQTILTGFGVQDSHLFPHQFTRAPGNWIWMAQGAFNYGKVKTARGQEIQFDQTRMAKFRYDGSEFDITSQGPCNIWGLVLNQQGEAFIQEANDYGYPLMPFHEHANYPGCSNGQFKSYAPEFPGTAPHFKMGGTGLSGLALSDARGAWPEPYANIFYVANPITRMIQAIKVHRDGPRYRLEKLPDFLLSGDEMFRPVAIAFGPDGCLYIVDWYNKIISHNEVPRTHPERDKKRGRIWRVKHKDQKPFEVPDFTKLPSQELLSRLGGDSIAQHHMAWQAIADRNLAELAPDLERLVASKSEPAARRIGALWALEAMGETELPILKALLAESNRNLRRESVRAFSESGINPGAIVNALAPLVNDPDPEVRAQVIRTAGALASEEPAAVALCIEFARPSLDGPTGRSTHNGRVIKVGEAYEREFERYLVRLFLERSPQATAAFLDSDAAERLPIENRLVAALALPSRESALRVARLLEQAPRPPNDEELLRMAEFATEPAVIESLRSTIENPRTQAGALEGLLKVRNRFDATPLRPAIGNAAHHLWHGDAEARQLALRLIGGFRIQEMNAELAESLRNDGQPLETQLAVLRALREIRSPASELFADLAQNHPDRRMREEALAALAVSSAPDAASRLVKLWPELNHLQRRSALDQLAGTQAGARAVVEALASGNLPTSDLNAALVHKLQTVLPGDQKLASITRDLQALFRPVLRLDGKGEAWLDTAIHLEGPFTVESWVKLDPGIDNSDGLLGAPGIVDMNFHDARFRVWVNGHHDVIIARKQIVPDSWTHVAVTRDQEGHYRIYLNGELDTDQSKPAPETFPNLRTGWTGQPRGTHGWLTEFRVWNHARTPEEIRASFDLALDGPKPKGLLHRFAGHDWPKPHPSAEIRHTDDFPRLLGTDEAREQAQKFERFRTLATHSGDTARGKELFAAACLTCHTVDGQGAQLGPVLSGAGAMGTDALLRAILTPNAAMEAGYRTFRVELRDGELLDGMLVAQDEEALVLRQPNSEDRRIPQDEILRAGYLKVSLMPEGLLESFSPDQAADLLAYLKTLK